MSALAQTLLDAEAEVSGSDRLLDRGDETPVLARLRRQGVRLFPQNGGWLETTEPASCPPPESGPGPASPPLPTLVVSTAIESDNRDLLAAKAAGAPVVHRARALADALADREVLAVAGTCGKSTVTAMLGWILVRAGLDPVVVNGAEVAGWDEGGTRVGSVRKGAGKYAVVEVDESDKSLLVFRPAHAVLTNASADHFGLEETLALFQDFRARVAGTIVEGLPDGASGFHTRGGRGGFSWKGTEFRIPVPGEYNLRNALHAAALAEAVGVAPEVSARALADFPGVARRMQRTGTWRDGARSVPVFDDYAHNVEKLCAALGALTADFSDGICAVWRPHGYGPLRKLHTGLAEMFGRCVRPCDTLLVLPVYDAGGTADRSYTSEEFLGELHAAGVAAEYVADLDAAEARMRDAAKAGAGALVTFGARDPGLPRLAAKLGS